MAIKTFDDSGLEKFFYTGSKKKINPQHAKKLALILDQLDAANDFKDIDFPGSGLHKLSGKLKDFYAISVSGNWRVIFYFKEGNIYNVDYLDYH